MMVNAPPNSSFGQAIVGRDAKRDLHTEINSEIVSFERTS